jgi:hypothetical protein
MRRGVRLWKVWNDPVTAPARLSPFNTFQGVVNRPQALFHTFLPVLLEGVESQYVGGPALGNHPSPVG